MIFGQHLPRPSSLSFGSAGRTSTSTLGDGEPIRGRCRRIVELAILFDVGGEYGAREEDTPLVGLVLVMELTDEGWLVADFQWGDDDPPTGEP